MEKSQNIIYLVAEPLNEKTFRDRGSGFVEILSYKLWDNCSKTVAWGDKFII